VLKRGGVGGGGGGGIKSGCDQCSEKKANTNK